jgi:hypothetical protein
VCVAAAFPARSATRLVTCDCASVGTSPATSARNVGAAGLPVVGPASTACAACVPPPATPASSASTRASSAASSAARVAASLETSASSALPASAAVSPVTSAMA